MVSSARQGRAQRNYERKERGENKYDGGTMTDELSFPEAEVFIVVV